MMNEGAGADVGPPFTSGRLVLRGDSSNMQPRWDAPSWIGAGVQRRWMEVIISTTCPPPTMTSWGSRTHNHPATWAEIYPQLKMISSWNHHILHYFWLAAHLPPQPQENVSQGLAVIVRPDVTDANKADLFLKAPNFSPPSVFGWLSLADYVVCELDREHPLLLNCSNNSKKSWFLFFDHGNQVNMFCRWRVCIQGTFIILTELPETGTWWTLKKFETSCKTKWSDLLYVQIKAFGWCCRCAAVTAAELQKQEPTFEG